MTEAPEPAPAAPKKNPLEKFTQLPKKTRVIATAGLAMVVVLGVSGAVWGTTAASAHQVAVQDAKSDLASFHRVEARNLEARARLSLDLAAAAALDPKLTAIVTGGVNLLDAGTLAELEKARAALAGKVKEAGQPAAADGTVALVDVFEIPTVPAVSEKDSDSTLAAAEAKYTTARKKIQANTALVDADRKALATVTDAAGGSLPRPWQPASNVLAAAPSADQASIDALSKATYAAIVKHNTTDTLQLLSTFFTTVKGLKDSHAAVEAQKAAEAAARANAPTYTDPSTGETRSNPSYNGRRRIRRRWAHRWRRWRQRWWRRRRGIPDRQQPVRPNQQLLRPVRPV